MTAFMAPADTAPTEPSYQERYRKLLLLQAVDRYRSTRAFPRIRPPQRYGTAGPLLAIVLYPYSLRFLLAL